MPPLLSTFGANSAIGFNPGASATPLTITNFLIAAGGGGGRSSADIGAEAVAPAITTMVKAETAAPVVAQACTQLLPVKEQPVRVMMVACPMTLTLVRVVVAEKTQ